MISDGEALDAFFDGYPEGRALFEDIRRRVDALGECSIKIGKSQVAFIRQRPFAAAWHPEQYLGSGAPLVLTIFLHERDPSPRWKEVVEPAHDRFTHHLELRSSEDLDLDVDRWLRQAWSEAT